MSQLFNDRPDRTMLRRALFLMTVCGIVAFIVLTAQLFRLQILRHSELESAALEQQLRRTVLPAGRGTIYDRNNQIIAQEVKAYTIVAYLDESYADADGNPDYAFMEEYIKSLPFSVRL